MATNVNKNSHRGGTIIDPRSPVKSTLIAASRAAMPTVVDDNEQTLLAEVAYVEKNLTQAKGRTKRNTTKSVVHDRSGYSAATNTTNYNIYAYIYDLDTVVGKKLPTNDDGEEFAEMYRSGVLIHCVPLNEEVIKKQGLPKVKEKIWIRCNPLDSKREGKYIGRYNKNDFTSTLTTRKKIKRSVSLLSGGRPLVTGAELHGLATDSPKTEKAQGVQFTARQPSAWLKACAVENGWAANLVTTTWSPPEYKVESNPTNIAGLGGKSPLFSDRIFLDQRAISAGANNQNKLFSIVYHDGQTSIREWWEHALTAKRSIHYYVNSRSKVHEFVDPTKKANHCSNNSCPGNDDLSIGIAYCHHSTNFKNLYNENNIKNSLRARYRFLLQNGYMLIGAPNYTGIPVPHAVCGATSVASSYHDSYIIGGKETLEIGWQLTKCLAKKYNIPIEGAIPQIKMIHEYKSSGNPPSAGVTAGSTNKIPYFYNLNDIKKYLPSYQGKFLCGFDGMIKYPGIRSFAAVSANKYDGGKPPEFYAFCRMSGYSKEEAYYATLGSMILPGVTKGGRLGSSDYIVKPDIYKELFGELHTNMSAVPNPADPIARTALLEYGRKVYTIAEFYRSLILYKDSYASNIADKFSPGLIASAILDVDENNPWQEIALSLSEETKPCLEIFDILRIKIGNQMKLSDISLTNDKINDYESDLGLYVTKLALDLFIYVSKESDNNAIEDCLDDDEEIYDSFAKSFKDKYKFDIKTVVNI